MAIKFYDRVKEFTEVVGYNTIVLTGTSAGFRTFNAAAQNGDELPYCISDPLTGQWEIGVGLFEAPNILQRTTINCSSNANNAVSFGVGVKDVFVTEISQLLQFCYDTSTTIRPTAIAMIMTGDWRYVPLVLLQAPGSAQLLNSTIVESAGKWIYAFAYSENNMVLGAEVRTLALSDLTGTFGNMAPTGLPLITSISLPALRVVGGNFVPSFLPLLTTLNIPLLRDVVGSFNPTSCGSLATLSVPSLVNVGGSFAPSTMGVLTTLSIPELTTVTSSFSPASMTILQSIAAPKLTHVGVSIAPAMSSQLLTVSFPALVSVGQNITFSSSTQMLANLTLGNTLKFIGGTVSITSNALTQASVDHILERLASLDGTNGTTAFSGKTITITGGAAAPSAAGLVSKTILLGRSCEVFHN